MLLSNVIAALPEAAAGERFVARVYRLRALGLALAALAVGSVLYQNAAPPLLWVLLFCHGLLWPQLARALANANEDPKRVELRNLLIDSALGGFWVAAMRFNVLPSVLLLTMLAVDKISVGGWRMLERGLAAQVLACVATVLLLCAWEGAFPWQPESSMPSVLASLPFLVAYPLLISAATHALASKALRRNRELELNSTVDAATGLWNRVTWQKALELELRHLHRYGRSASLLMIDIDHFKQVNDRYGHPLGDAVIAMVAAAIRDGVRDIDVACRYGGDEFGVLLTHTGEHAATVVAERIRARVAAGLIANAPGLHCTLSIGIACASAEMHSAAAWIERADAGLYRAKMLGRNQAARLQEDPLGEGPDAPFTQS
ncbi:MAG TPA: diguanylate cyclase [Dokdonella sp.]